MWEGLVHMLLPTTLPNCGIRTQLAYIVLGRSLLAARPLRPITLTIPPVPQTLTMITVLVHGHSTSRVLKWIIPDYDFLIFVCLDLVTLFSLRAFGSVFRDKSVYNFVLICPTSFSVRPNLLFGVP